jgi:hypothetical protein
LGRKRTGVSAISGGAALVVEYVAGGKEAIAFPLLKIQGKIRLSVL